ncbi:MAG: hypothetical protein F6K58_28465 [Symploca sp. SIO2E9]|nr:hypothetical protein [Symploca sp. SIO2E9]
MELTPIESNIDRLTYMLNTFETTQATKTTKQALIPIVKAIKVTDTALLNQE